MRPRGHAHAIDRSITAREQAQAVALEAQKARRAGVAAVDQQLGAAAQQGVQRRRGAQGGEPQSAGHAGGEQQQRTPGQAEQGLVVRQRETGEVDGGVFVQKCRPLRRQLDPPAHALAGEVRADDLPGLQQPQDGVAARGDEHREAVVAGEQGGRTRIEADHAAIAGDDHDLVVRLVHEAARAGDPGEELQLRGLRAPARDLVAREQVRRAVAGVSDVEARGRGREGGDQRGAAREAVGGIRREQAGDRRRGAMMVMVTAVTQAERSDSDSRGVRGDSCGAPENSLLTWMTTILRGVGLAPQFIEDTYRCPALAGDLGSCFDLTPGAAEVVPAAQAYAERLYRLADAAPSLLVAHAYTRYLGDLSGGQILRRGAARTLGLPTDAPAGTPGLGFYDFAVDDLDRCKQDIRARLDALPIDPGQATAIIGEARWAFTGTAAVFAELLPGPAAVREPAQARAPGP